MTYAQEMLDKGRAEGRMETRVEVVEGLLRAGMAWDVIEAATGLTEARLPGPQGAVVGPVTTWLS